MADPTKPKRIRRPASPDWFNRKKRELLIAKITPETLECVEYLSGLGLTQTQIHDFFGIGNNAWYERKKDYPELEIAFARGKAQTIGRVSGKLMEKIESGDLGAIIFYLKTQARWRDGGMGGSDEGGDKPISALTITVNDPVEAAKIYQQIMIGS
jgi:hypothetical protein